MVNEETSEKTFVFESDRNATQKRRLILFNCNQTRSELCKRAAKTTADYRNHSVSEQSNSCRVAAWENTGPRRPTDKPAKPDWLLSSEVEPSSRLRLPLMALAQKGVWVSHCGNEAFQNAKTQIHSHIHTHTRPDCSLTCSWGLFDNTPVTFHLSGLKPNYRTITAYKWFFPRRHQWIVFVCQSGTGQKQD